MKIKRSALLFSSVIFSVFSFQAFLLGDVAFAQDEDYIVQSPQWILKIGNRPIYSDPETACQSVLGMPGYQDRTLKEIIPSSSPGSKLCILEATNNAGETFDSQVLVSPGCPQGYQYFGEDNGLCFSENALNQPELIPANDEVPDFSPCSYYDEVAATDNCKYHAFAGEVCRGNITSVNFLVKACKISQGEQNCIRTCLVEADKLARATSECQIDCSDGVCTKQDCIDKYHVSCFSDCGVTPFCYGGVYYPFFPNDDGNCLVASIDGKCLVRK